MPKTRLLRRLRRFATTKDSLSPRRPMESFPYVIARTPMSRLRLQSGSRTLDEIGVLGGVVISLPCPPSGLPRFALNDRCAGAAPPDPQTVLSPLAGDSRSEGDSTIISISDAIGVSTQSDLSLKEEEGRES